MNHLNKTNLITTICLLVILLIGTILRVNNLSSFRIYPDSYQSLMVAYNLRQYGQVVGTMGPLGMIYPDFISWTRPVYPLLINIFHFFNPNDFFNAQIVSLILGICSLLIIYLLLNSLFKSKIFGIFGSLLLSISFNHITWGGYILTETTGLFFMILFLWRLFASINSSSKLANVNDLVTGFLFALAVLTRYEYISLIIPLIYLIFSSNSTPFKKFLNIISSAIFVFSVFIYKFFPSSNLFSPLINQAKDSLVTFGYLLVFLVVLLIIKKYLKAYINISLKILLLLSVTVLLTGLFKLELSGLREFFYFDFSIGIFFVIGSLFLLNTKKYLSILYFCLISIAILGAIYMQINFEMQRYWTHLLPFFLIPASFGLSQIFKSKRKLLLLPIIFLFVWQLKVSWQGIKDWQQGAWYSSKNYEEIIASKLSPFITDNKLVLLSSTPEPYFLASSTSVHSIADQYPYVFMQNIEDNQNILIIQDAGMYHYFPNFSSLISNNLHPYEITEFFTGIDYYSVDQIYKEKRSVKLYKIKLIELKSIINSNTPIQAVEF